MADSFVSILVQQLERTRTLGNRFWWCSAQSITEMLRGCLGGKQHVGARGRTEGRHHWGHPRAQEHSWRVGAGICHRAWQDKYVLI